MIEETGEMTGEKKEEEEKKNGEPGSMAIGTTSPAACI
jgi:hypothetical protein